MYFFFNDTATTEIYTLSLHDALPISGGVGSGPKGTGCIGAGMNPVGCAGNGVKGDRKNTSELQSRQYLVCRLLLEKKKTSPLCYHALIDPPHQHLPFPLVPLHDAVRP